MRDIPKFASAMQVESSSGGSEEDCNGSGTSAGTGGGYHEEYNRESPDTRRKVREEIIVQHGCVKKLKLA